MKNYLTNYFIGLIIIAYTLYLTGAFMSADLNISNWGHKTREGIGCGFLFIWIVFSGIYYMNQRDETTD
jgi:hypothetical protein